MKSLGVKLRLQQLSQLPIHLRVDDLELPLQLVADLQDVLKSALRLNQYASFRMIELLYDDSHQPQDGLVGASIFDLRDSEYSLKYEQAVLTQVFNGMVL